MPQLNIIELFAGAGGLAQGFVRSGHYNILALYDIFEPARKSYLEYDPNAIYRLEDVKYLEKEKIFNDLGGRPLHGIIGGPPCQGFSLAGKKLSEAEINQLVLSYARVVNELKPFFLVMENVPQLMFHALFEPLVKGLEENYNLSYAILNSARYGTPQTRHRLFLIAYRKDLNIQPSFPLPTHGKLGQCLYAYHLTESDCRIPLTQETSDFIFSPDSVIKRKVAQQAQSFVSTLIDETLKPLITVGDAISDLADCTYNDDELLDYSSPAMSEYQLSLRAKSDKVANGIARKHKDDLLQVIGNLREGGTPQSENTSRNKRYYSQAYGRLHRDGLARTLTTYFQNAGSGRFLHYEQPRTLTIREAARLQGFSDDFVFYGNLADQMQLVGNAVPLPLAEAVGRQVAKEIKSLIVS
jgi:DNA (cytosine-5)-methyltransferase 1